MKRFGDERPLHWRWITAPALLSALLVLPFTLYFGSLVVTLQGSRSLFFVLSGAVMVLGLLLTLFRNGARASALKRLSDDRAQPTPELLTAALREAHGFADHQFRVMLEHWIGAGVLLGLGLWFLGNEPLHTCVRAMGVPALMGPTAAVLAYVLTLRRARRSTRHLASMGLTPKEVIAALPRRHQLVLRFALFAIVTTVTPVLLTAELGLTHTRAELKNVAALTVPGERRAAAERVRREVILHVTGLGLMMGGLALLAAFLAGTALGDPIAEIAEEAGRLSEGKPSEAHVIPAEDEVWVVSAAFTAMHQRVNGVLEHLRLAGTRIGVTSQQILATSARFEATAAEQASALNETTATTEELARSAAQIAENAATVSSQAEQTLVAVHEGQTHAEAFTRSMERMREDNRSVSTAVAKLSRRVVQIGRIVEFINAIADKSDLLALSAELEGTKAGEVGRGFGLVASEMRRLAENVLESTREIEELIREIREATHAAVQATEAGVRATEDGGRHGTEVGTGLAQIVTLAQQTTESVKAISLATQQQQSGTDQLAQSMARILSITEGNMRATRQVATRNAELSEVAHKLKAVVDRFGTSGG